MPCTVIVFGDPDITKSVGAIASQKVDSFCHKLDIVCDTASGIAAGWSSHLTYGIEGEAAASFVVEKMKNGSGGEVCCGCC
jgi:Cutinase